jgi:hypothetical protein
MKLKFGFVKVRYRGLEKNGDRLFAASALVNLRLVHKKPLNAATCCPAKTPDCRMEVAGGLKEPVG